VRIIKLIVCINLFESRIWMHYCGKKVDVGSDFELMKNSGRDCEEVGNKLFGWFAS